LGVRKKKEQTTFVEETTDRGRDMAKRKGVVADATLKVDLVSTEKDGARATTQRLLEGKAGVVCQKRLARKRKGDGKKGGSDVKYASAAPKTLPNSPDG